MNNSGFQYFDKSVCHKECQLAGGNLTSIHSPEENNFLASILRTSKSKFGEQTTWIGNTNFTLVLVIKIHCRSWTFRRIIHMDWRNYLGIFQLAWRLAQPSLSGFNGLFYIKENQIMEKMEVVFHSDLIHPYLTSGMIGRAQWILGLIAFAKSKATYTFLGVKGNKRNQSNLLF